MSCERRWASPTSNRPQLDGGLVPRPRPLPARLETQHRCTREKSIDYLALSESGTASRLRQVIVVAAVVAWCVFVFVWVKVSERRRERQRRAEWEARKAQMRTREQFLEAQYDRTTATLRTIATGPSGPAQEEALEALRINHNAELQREGMQDEVVWKGDESRFLPELGSAEPN